MNIDTAEIPKADRQHHRYPRGPIKKSKASKHSALVGDPEHVHDGSYSEEVAIPIMSSHVVYTRLSRDYTDLHLQAGATCEDRVGDVGTRMPVDRQDHEADVDHSLIEVVKRLLSPLAYIC